MTLIAYISRIFHALVIAVGITTISYMITLGILYFVTMMFFNDKTFSNNFIFTVLALYSVTVLTMTIKQYMREE